jgi:mono/diheme cytochrome c family protein
MKSTGKLFLFTLAVACACLAPGCTKGDDVKPDEKAGMAVYLEFCQQCHSLRSPDTHTSAEWPDVVRRMRTHMAQKKRKELSDEQTDQLLVYLKEHAKR